MSTSDDKAAGADVLAGTRVELVLTAQGRRAGSARATVGRNGRFTARVRTKARRGLRLTATIAPTASTAETTRTVAVR